MKRWKLMAVALAAALLLTLCAACGKKAEEQTDGDGKPGSTQQDTAKDANTSTGTNTGNSTVDSVLDVSGGVVENPFAEDTSDKSQTEDAKKGEPPHSGGNSGNTSAPDASQNLKWEEFYALSATQKDAYMESFGDYQKFYDWMVKAQEQFKTEHPTIEIGPDGSIDLSKLG